MKKEHKDIRISFEIEDRRFEAVGFLGKGEGREFISAEEVLRRTASENGGAVDAMDAFFIANHAYLLPQELHSYWLVSNRYMLGHRYPALACFCRKITICQAVSFFGSDYLVLRRCR